MKKKLAILLAGTMIASTYLRDVVLKKRMQRIKCKKVISKERNGGRGNGKQNKKTERS